MAWDKSVSGHLGLCCHLQLAPAQASLKSPQCSSNIPTALQTIPTILWVHHNSHKQHCPWEVQSPLVLGSYRYSISLRGKITEERAFKGRDSMADESLLTQMPLSRTDIALCALQDREGVKEQAHRMFWLPQHAMACTAAMHSLLPDNNIPLLPAGH